VVPNWFFSWVAKTWSSVDWMLDERSWPHVQLGRDVPGALLPLVQARLLARHLRGDLDTYQPWTVS
jgi:hypothetical protein